jgi:hypothetical protein
LALSLSSFCAPMLSTCPFFSQHMKNTWECKLNKWIRYKKKQFLSIYWSLSIRRLTINKKNKIVVLKYYNFAELIYLHSMTRKNIFKTSIVYMHLYSQTDKWKLYRYLSISFYRKIRNSRMKKKQLFNYVLIYLPILYP